MSLDTLLEAARYLELQELKEQQQRQALAPLVRIHPQPAPLTPQPVAILKNKQESVITIQQPLHQPPQPQHQRVIQNSFDLINPLIIDEGGEQKRKQPPLVFRSGTREVHNKLEKHRRAHLKECFDILKKQLPAQIDEKKTSNLSILHSALRYIQSLKRKERELDHEMERLAREKISAQQKLAALKRENPSHSDADSNASETLILNAVEETSPNLSERVSQVKQTQTFSNGFKENTITVTSSITQHPQVQQHVQTTALSVVPMTGYPVSQGLVLHKLALVPKGIGDLSPLTAVSSPVAHFITTAPTQQLNGKVLPMVNAQYVVKPVVVVSSPPSVVPRPS